MMENEDKYEPPIELIGVTNTVTFNEIHDADVTNVSDKSPDVTDVRDTFSHVTAVNDKYPDSTDANDKYPDSTDANDKYPDVTDVSGRYEDESDIGPAADNYKYNIGRNFDDDEVNESSSLTDEEYEWTAENESRVSPILSDEHDERRKDLDNKRKRTKMSKTGRNVKQWKSNVSKMSKELEGVIERPVRQLRNAFSHGILQISTKDLKKLKKDQKKSYGTYKKGNEESNKNEISNATFLFISNTFRSNSPDDASVIAKFLLKIDKITYPIKMFIRSRDSFSRLEYVRLVQFDTGTEWEDPKYQPLKAIDTSPIQTSSGNNMVNSKLDTIKGTAQHTSDFDDEDVGQQRSCRSPLIARTQNINMKSMPMVCVFQYQRGFLVLAVFRGSPRGIQQTNVILITSEMIYFLLNNSRRSSVFNIQRAIPNVVKCFNIQRALPNVVKCFNIQRAIPNVVKCFNRWLCVNDISFNFKHLAQFYKPSLKMSPEKSWNRTRSSDFSFEKQFQPSVDMIPIVKNAMEPYSFKQIDHNSMDPQESMKGHWNLIGKPLTGSVMAVKTPDMNLTVTGGVRKKSRTKDRKQKMNRVKMKQPIGRSPSGRSNTYQRKGIMEENCAANSERKGMNYQKGTPDLNKGFFNGHGNRLSRYQSEYTENYRKVSYESEYHCGFGFTDNIVQVYSSSSLDNVRGEEEVESYEILTSKSGTGVFSIGIEEKGDIGDIQNDGHSNPSGTRANGCILNIQPTDNLCSTKIYTSATPHPANQRRNNVPFKTTKSIPPEGGTNGNVVLINTCPIDGFLLMIYLVLESDRDRRNQFEDSDNELEKKYFEIWNAFKEKKFGIGKLIWCIYGGSVSFEEMTAGSQIIVDITGSDNQRIFSVLGKHSLDVEYRCTNQDCPDPTMINTDPYKVLPIYETDRQLLSGAITKGIGDFLRKDMGLCTNRKRNGEICTGTMRRSIVEPPLIFPVNLYFIHFDGNAKNSSDIPEEVECNDLMYDLYLVRFFKDNHFVDKIKVDGVWTYYDNSRGELYYFDDDWEGAVLSTCYYIKRGQNL